ncbi:dual specificity protein phosphatase family protein [Vulcanococcus limneticus Candia 3F8]|uniref:protein-tyrosine phosphatase family protein n=1 Tax=Vulcanococcus limneticus TaxID=2170428 RepID=UPI000B985117|nr:dual specificity protein phosphatase [Vulcanococcus limneticus]MCP9791113.1 dual specificity protein phosphatase family protein [Vulcanococcus limneticus MW73D5]MCP9893738.1 dual specificity protein phosphatase family protein [Vulcanococcus limneticus Candia 3F8]MCP9896511.1 dual specificity protein phosphatase family protein [Vulcanococcus limneticus Candia 3B3]
MLNSAGRHSGPRFRISWVIRQRLALGPAPRRPEHCELLEREGLAAIFSLCSEAEAAAPPGLDRFVTTRLVLPDHRSDQSIEVADLLQALDVLTRLQQAGPVFVHCLASMERSPLVCMAWLVRSQGFSPLQALDYLMQIHPGTSPLPSQWQALCGLASEAAPTWGDQPQ